MERLSTEVRTRIFAFAAADSPHSARTLLTRLSLVSRACRPAAQALLFRDHSRLNTSAAATAWLRTPLSATVKSLSVLVWGDNFEAIFKEATVPTATREAVIQKAIRRPVALGSLRIHFADGVPETLLLEDSLRHLKHLTVATAGDRSALRLANLPSLPLFRLESLSLDVNSSITLVHLLIPAVAHLDTLSLEDTTTYPAAAGFDPHGDLDEDGPFLDALNALFASCRASLRALTVTQHTLTEDDDFIMTFVGSLPRLERFEHRGPLCDCCVAEFLVTIPESVTRLAILEAPPRVAARVVHLALEPALAVRTFGRRAPRPLPNVREVVLPAGTRGMLGPVVRSTAEKRGIEIRFVELS
ncbi:hypothetical protein JCM10450v2_005231 [Rhodotorula kratochvilovae]